MAGTLPNPTAGQIRERIAWAERLLTLSDEQLKVEARDYMYTDDVEAIRMCLRNDVHSWRLYLALNFDDWR